MFRDLRHFLKFLEDHNELLRVRREIDPEFELGALVRKSNNVDGPALYFESLKRYTLNAVANVAGSRRRIAYALGCPVDEMLGEYLRRTQNLIPPKEISDGPVKEVIVRGDDVQLSTLPAPILNHKDGGFYISGDVTIARHPDTGVSNAGIYRFMVAGRNKLKIDITAPQHLALFHQRSEELGKPLPISITIGHDPIIYLAAASPAPWQVDELAYAGALRQEPVEVVRSETSDILVPANSEIVIEGRILPNAREPEGPFGEFTGYYTIGKNKPTVEVTAISHRHKPIFQVVYTGQPMTENHILNELGTRARLYTALKQVVPEVVDVNLTTGGCNVLHAVISVKKKYEELGKRVIYAAFGAYYVLKQVVVVDEDIDIFNPMQVEWAMATRMQPHEDVIILAGDRGMPLDPSMYDVGGSRTTSKIGIDATVPLTKTFPEVAKPKPEAMQKAEEIWDDLINDASVASKMTRLM